MNAPEQAALIDPPQPATTEAPHLVARINSVAIKAAFPFIAQDDVRFYLQGVNIRPLEDGTAMIVATDGHRFVIVRDPNGFIEEEVIASVSKDAIKHAAADVTFDVMSNGQAIWNDAVTNPLFIQPGKSTIDGDFPRIESVVSCIGYSEGISGSVNTEYLADVLKIKIGSKAPAIRFFTRDSDSPMLFVLSGIGEIEVLGGVMKVRDSVEWLPRWLPANGEFSLQREGKG